MYVYQNTEPGLFTVGFFDPQGNWHSDSDHGDKEEAAKRVNLLNGGNQDTLIAVSELPEVESAISSGSVRVMRSYDYCHFEICLSVDENANLDQVNERRKEAALLVDEAIRQYKIAKKAEDKRDEFERALDRYLRAIERIQEKPESEWTIEDAAMMRSYESGEYWKEAEEGEYYYGENPDRDHHFSMLRRFQDTRISAA